jgi:hypothetical protein
MALAVRISIAQSVPIEQVWPFRGAVIVLSLCALGPADAPGRALEAGRPIYAITGTATAGRVLSKRDPMTLARIGPQARLSGSSQAAAFSPDVPGSRSWSGQARRRL